MAGSLLNKARRDSKKYLTKGGFRENIILETADGSVIIETFGFVSAHWTNFETAEGVGANTKNAHITIDEAELSLLEYPLRNSEHEVSLFNHKVRVKHSDGILRHYIIKEWFPNETLGLIACILADSDDGAMEIEVFEPENL